MVDSVDSLYNRDDGLEEEVIQPWHVECKDEKENDQYCYTLLQ